MLTGVQARCFGDQPGDLCGVCVCSGSRDSLPQGKDGGCPPEHLLKGVGVASNRDTELTTRRTEVPVCMYANQIVTAHEKGFT